MGGFGRGGNALTVCRDNSLVLPTRKIHSGVWWWLHATHCLCKNDMMVSSGFVFSVKEGFSQIRGRWAFLYVLFCLTSIMIADVNYTVVGFPVNPSVVFTHCSFPLHLPVPFLQTTHRYSVSAKREFCVISFPRGGCVCSGLRVSAKLGSAIRNMEKCVCSHMERKLIQLNQFVQYVCSIRELQLCRISWGRQKKQTNKVIIERTHSKSNLVTLPLS